MQFHGHEIDAVISWVDGDDPRHAAKRETYIGQNVHASARAATRFADRGEIGYCVVSVLRFCPFVRRVFIVTDAQYPAALKPILAARPDWRGRVDIVDHLAIYGEHADLLPVFSSRSIETMIHRVPGLAEHFIYLNDDVFIGRQLAPDHFFRAGKPVLRGRMKRFPNSLVERARSALLPGVRRAGFSLAQQKAARLTGCRRSYLLASHRPHPMRRSTVAGFFADRPALLRAQAGHRFRSPDQFSPVGLANHLELALGAPVEAADVIGLLKPPRRGGGRAAIETTLSALNRGALDSLCVQSLDEMSEADQLRVMTELDRRYSRNAAAPGAQPHPGIT